MFFEILFFTFIGIGAGTFTGLIPGIHPNTLALMLIGIVPLLLGYGIPVHAVIVLLISMAVTHTLVSFIPSILFGVPEDSTALSILPGHRLLLDGKGLEAIYLTVLGGVGVVIIFVLALPLLLKLLPILYEAIKYYIHFILIAIVSVMIMIESKLKGKLWGLAVFFLAGLLGVIVFNSTVLSPTIMFFPLFTGLFGISTLLISINKKVKIPKQKEEIGKIDRKLAIGGTLKAFFSGLLIGILPGVGSAQATVLAQQITMKKDNREFLVSVGGINTVVALSSLVALYAIGRPRSGIAVAVDRILESFGFNELLLLIASGLIATGIGAILTLKLSKKLLSLLQKIPYDKLSLGIIGFLILLTFFLAGPLGLLVLFVSTAIGLIAPLTGVKRSLCMGVLILPVVLFYSGLII